MSSVCSRVCVYAACWSLCHWVKRLRALFPVLLAVEVDFQQTSCWSLHHCNFDWFMYLRAWCRLDCLYRQGRCRQHLRVVRSLSRRCSRCGQPRRNSLLPIHLRSARCGRCTCTGGWSPAMVSLQVCLPISALCRELVCMWYRPVYGYKYASCLQFDAGYLQKKGVEIHAGCV